MSSVPLQLAEDLFERVNVEYVRNPSGFKARVKQLMRFVIKMARKIVAFILRADSWKLKRTWIGALVFLRLAYVAMNEYGMNPFKK